MRGAAPAELTLAPAASRSCANRNGGADFIRECVYGSDRILVFQPDIDFVPLPDCQIPCGRSTVGTVAINSGLGPCRSTFTTFSAPRTVT